MHHRRNLLLSLLIINPAIFIYSQSLDYGAVLIYNSSSQTNYDPTIPEDGTFQWNALGTWGFGGFASKELAQKWTTRLSLFYQQKGYKELAQVVYVPGGPLYYEDLHNTFHYISSELTIDYRLTASPSLRTYISIGAEYNYLLDYNIESDFVPINMFYPVHEYQDRWEKHTLNIHPAVALTFNQATTIEFGFNGSLTPVLKTENLIVRDWIWTIRARQSVARLFK